MSAASGSAPRGEEGALDTRWDGTRLDGILAFAEAWSKGDTFEVSRDDVAHDLVGARRALASLRARLGDAEELLREARDTVSTHAMQTYSKVSRDLANRIDAALEQT